MSNLKMKNLVLGMVQTNCYIISNEAAKEAIVFDPADDADRIEQYLKANDLVCRGILLTHGHFDHILAAKELAEAVEAPIYAHESEAALLNSPELNCSSQIHRECSLVPDILLKDDELLQLAGFTIKVIHTPGHTSGGVCYYFTGHDILISGDTLFRECIGRSDLPTGNGSVLVESIRNKLMLFDDQVIVYPGHGKPTTIGYEKDHNFYISDDPDLFDM
ncbi:MAG TPA: MBL fold metallo-hydrolase [Mobilitalea sp.]|nr:MBL fold metallo-hydrolase [Mobilitalea sp.]